MKLTKINFTVIDSPFKGVDIEKVLVSNKISFSEINGKCFIGYLYDNHKVKPLRIMLPNSSAYVKSYDKNLMEVFFD